jgi:hypothetical protein
MQLHGGMDGGRASKALSNYGAYLGYAENLSTYDQGNMALALAKNGHHSVM